MEGLVVGEEEPEGSGLEVKEQDDGIERVWQVAHRGMLPCAAVLYKCGAPPVVEGVIGPPVPHLTAHTLIHLIGRVWIRVTSC